MPSLTHPPGRIHEPSADSASTEFDCLSIIDEMIIYTHGKDFTLVCDETDSWIGINVF